MANLISSHEAVELDTEVVARWREAKAAAANSRQLLEEAEAKLKAMLGDCDEGTVDGVTVVTWRAQSRHGALNEAALIADGVDVEKYRKPGSTFRVLRAVSAKKLVSM